MAPEVRIIGIQGMPEVTPGDDLARLILEAAQRQGVALESGDILVVTQKVVSKAEGQVVHLGGVEPSELARRLAQEWGKDPRHVEVVLRESYRIVRMDRGLIISQTRHGFNCANAGVDASNLPDRETLCLLPRDPDASARRIRSAVKAATGADVAVIISDTFGRPWRVGLTNVAIGVAGINPLKDYRGIQDPYGHMLQATVIAVADELASAAELVTGKISQVPVALIRGYPYEADGPGASALVRPPEQDLFR